jgi:voltage-gated potassium channel
VIGEELARVLTWSERHRRLTARLLLVLLASLVVDAIGSVLIFFLERHAEGGDIHSFGDALFFTTVQLLTVSSQIRNPRTAAGRVVDVALEVWGVIVVAGSAGAVGTFFQSAD